MRDTAALKETLQRQRKPCSYLCLSRSSQNIRIVCLANKAKVWELRNKGGACQNPVDSCIYEAQKYCPRLLC